MNDYIETCRDCMLRLYDFHIDCHFCCVTGKLIRLTNLACKDFYPGKATDDVVKE